MRIQAKRITTILALAAVGLPASAQAQATASDLLAMSVSQLKGEIGRRYEAALALTRDGGTVSADDPRYLWALQAKAQCGIALGFLKSSTKDPVSIGKCVDAYNRMNQQAVAAPPAPAPVPAAPDPACAESIAGIVFFEFDSALPPESAMPTIQTAARNLQVCGWRGLAIAGHTDRAGSDNYNGGLSRRRAEAVAQMLAAQGADRGVLNVTAAGESQPKIPTPDGERNPQNRRVEIVVQR
jgi:outer membrane protein OmpA-like peptidoglycan-associated protein